MKKALFLATCVLAILIGASALAADSAKTSEKPAKVKLHKQTLCPIMGNKIDKSFYLDIQGQRVYFCCAGCSDKFKADADKYFKKAAADGVLFENTQKVCPVTGDKIENKKAFTDYEGRRVYFCCRGCISKFAADPAKYLKRFDMPADSVQYDHDMNMN